MYCRPKTAGPRYREWKTWLTEKMNREEQKAQAERDRADRRKENIRAFERWLSKKDRYSSPYYLDDDSETDSGNDNDSENEKAYKSWTDNKKRAGVFAKLDTHRRQALRGKENYTGNKEPEIYGNKRLTIYDIGCTDPTPIIREHPAEYMNAFRNWRDRRHTYDSWKRQQQGMTPRTEHAQSTSMKDVVASRGVLLMEGMTYEEWLGQKEREQRTLSAHSKH